MRRIVINQNNSLTEQFREVLASQESVLEFKSKLSKNDNDRELFHEESERCTRFLDIRWNWNLEKIAEIFTGGNEFKWEFIRGDRHTSSIFPTLKYDSIALEWERKNYYSLYISLENGLVYFEIKYKCDDRSSLPFFRLGWSEVLGIDFSGINHVRIKLRDGGYIEYNHGVISVEQPKLYFRINEL